MRRHRIRLLAWLGLFGVAQFVLAAFILHLAQSVPRYMSEFAHGRFWLFWSLSLYSLAAGGIALGLALRPCLAQRCRSGRLGVAFLWLSALGSLAIATFPVDRTPRATTLAGAIHENAALATFAALCLAIVLVGLALRRSDADRALGRVSLAVGGTVACLCTAYALASAGTWAAVSVLQRVLVAIVAAWFLLVTGWVLVATRDGRQPGKAPVPAARLHPALTGILAAAPVAQDGRQPRGGRGQGGRTVDERKGRRLRPG